MASRLLFLIVCVKIMVNHVHSEEPFCPKSFYEEKLLEHAIESKALMKTVDDGVRQLANEVAVLSEKCAPSQTNNDLHGKLANLTEELWTLKDGIKDLRKIYDHELKGRNSRRLVAFSVNLSSHSTLTGYHGVIKFDTASYNVGNHYDSSTGVFTTPIDAVYQFSAHLMAQQGAEIWGYIKAPGNTHWMYARGTDNRHDQGSQTMIVALKQGDKVTVHGGPKVYGEHYSSFSGLMLHEL